MAVAIAEDPSLATMESIKAHIEVHGEYTRGQLIPDRRPIEGNTPNVRYCTDIKGEEFMDRFCEAVAKV